MKRKNRKSPKRRKIQQRKRSRITRVKRSSRKHAPSRRRKLVAVRRRRAITDPRVARGLGVMRREGVSASQAAHDQGMKLKTFVKGVGRFLYRSGAAKLWRARSEDQLRLYLGKPEVKSLAPDGTPCIGTTRGLLKRARITADKLVPVGKETDRRWEQGEDGSMIDFEIFIYEKRTRLVIADPDERKRFAAIGLRRLARESKLSLAPVGKAIKGKGVRRQTLLIIRQTAARITA